MAEEHILEFERPIYDLEHKIGEMKKHNKRGPKVHTDIETMEKNLAELKKKIYSELTAWEKTALARHNAAIRPRIRDVFISFSPFQNRVVSTYEVHSKFSHCIVVHKLYHGVCA